MIIFIKLINTSNFFCIFFNLLDTLTCIKRKVGKKKNPNLIYFLNNLIFYFCMYLLSPKMGIYGFITNT